jgi:NTP pyrophosphatase (non-canonical NTP hydrolase)
MDIHQMINDLQSPIVADDDLRFAMDLLGHESVLACLPALQVELAILIMRHWRQRMDKTRFKTPKPKRAIQYLFTESAEILDAYMKSTSDDLRNRPEPASIQKEYGDTLAMAITALIEEIVSDPSLKVMMSALLKRPVLRPTYSIYSYTEESIDSICIYAGDALRGIAVGTLVWTQSVIFLIRECMIALQGQVWIEYLNTLERWEQRAIKSRSLT